MIKESYSLISISDPKKINFYLDDILYQSEEYLRANGYPQLTYQLRNHQSEVIGQIHFYKHQDKLVSQPNAPFGSFIVTSTINTEQIEDFVLSVVKQIGPFEIKGIPALYGMPDVTSALSQVDNIEIENNVNHHINLEEFTEEKLHNMELRRIKKCIAAGFQIRKVHDPNRLEDVFVFISDCRKEQDLEINISKQAFMKNFKLMPNNYDCFIVVHENKIIASSILVKVSNTVIYNYLPASARRMNQYSPMVYLIKYLVEYYQELGFKYFDWGVTSIQGKLQESLATFKEHMGAERSLKPIFKRL